MNAVQDPNYGRYVLPRKERYSSFLARYREIHEEKKKEREEYLSSKKKLLSIRKEKRKEGMGYLASRNFVLPSLLNLTQKHKAKIDEIKGESKENRMVVFPFRLFYKPISYNGSHLLKPQGKSVVVGLVLLAIFVFSFYMCDPTSAVFNPDQIGAIFSQLFGPQGGMSSIHTWADWWAYMGNTAVPLIWETFMMMFVATVIGCLLSIPFMILCSTNIIKNKVVTGTNHVLLNIIRTFPTVVLAIIGVAFFGISNLAGIFAMVVFTAGIMIKIMFEFIETVDMNPYEASVSTGASKPQAFVVSIVPQIIPAFLSNALYTFEINIRASVVLGFVGAGGIGIEISNSIGEFKYNQVGAILVPLFILVVVLQLVSNTLKKRTM